MTKRVPSRAGLLLSLVTVAACGPRRVALDLPDALDKEGLATAIVTFEDSVATGPRYIYALDLGSPVAPLTVELADSEATHVTLLGMTEDLTELALMPGEVERAAVSGDALLLPNPAAVYSADLGEAPSWFLDADPVAALARIRIAGKSLAKTACDAIEAETREVELAGIDLRAVLILPDGSALVGGEGTDEYYTLGLVFQDLSLEPIALLDSPSIRGLARGEPDKVYAITSAGLILVIDLPTREVETESTSPYLGIANQDDGPLLAWTSSRTVELGPDLSVLRVRDDFPRPVEEIAADGSGGLFVMTSSAVFREQGGVWQQELCCPDFTIGKRTLFGLGEEAIASFEANVWIRSPVTRRWSQTPEAVFKTTPRCGAMLGPGQALTGGAVGRLQLWDGASWCDVRHSAEGTPRAFNDIDVDQTTGVFYAVTWFNGNGRLPVVVRGTFPP